MYELLLLNEKEQIERLAKLYKIRWEYNTPFYDKIAKLAAHICQTPIGLLTHVLRDKQEFKGSFGVDCSETPIRDSVCQYTLCNKTDTPLIIPDLSTNRTFDNNSLVNNSPNIKFYCGFPIRTSDDVNVGALCVIDIVPRELNNEQFEHLRLLVDIVRRTLKYT
jgi:GAF domain-containing protein